MSKFITIWTVIKLGVSSIYLRDIELLWHMTELENFEKKGNKCFKKHFLIWITTCILQEYETAFIRCSWTWALICLEPRACYSDWLWSIVNIYKQPGYTCLILRPIRATVVIIDSKTLYRIIYFINFTYTVSQHLPKEWQYILTEKHENMFFIIKKWFDWFSFSSSLWIYMQSVVHIWRFSSSSFMYDKIPI